MRIQHHPLPSNSSGCERSLQSRHFGRITEDKATETTSDSAANPRKVYIQASLHADEIPGMLVAQHLRSQLAALELAGKIPGEIVLVPVANPLGLAQSMLGLPFGRFDLSTGVNFNRGYLNLVPQLKTELAGKLGPDARKNVQLVRHTAQQLLSQWQPRIETDFLKRTLQGLALDADIVLDLHCDNEAVMHLYTGTPLAERVAPLSCLLRAEAVLLSRESGGDPFDETCSRLWWELAEHFGTALPLPLSCFAVTVELRGQTEVSHALAQQDAQSLIDFLVHEGHIERENQEIAALPAARCQPTPLEGVEPLYAPHAGIVVFHKTVGEAVLAGETIAEIIDPLSGQSSAVCASVSGRLFARTAFRYAQRNMDLAKIAGAVAYRSGKLLSE